MKYKKGDLLLLSAGSWTQQCHEEYFIVKDIYPNNTEEEYSYILHSITSNEEEHLNKCWVEYWTKKVG